MDEHTSKSSAQKQQLFELQCKALLLKGKKAPYTNKKLEVAVATIEMKKITVVSKFAEKPKSYYRDDLALHRKGTALDRANQEVDS